MRTNRVLITAGPTHEPIDEVRYLANRSSGRLGIEVAEAALDAGWEVTLALGPTHHLPRTAIGPTSERDSPLDTHDRSQRFHLVRFQTTNDLQAILTRLSPGVDVLVMAAAVADFRPAPRSDGSDRKIRRTDAGLILELEATPDLLAECTARRGLGKDQSPKLIVAFALEPSAGLQQAASRKLRRKGADLIVANPLETMDAPTVRAHLIDTNGLVASTPGEIEKTEFGRWLMSEITEYLAHRHND